MNIRLVDYRPEWQPHFERLNKAWLEEYFSVEPIDEYVLGQPEEALLRDGGAVLFLQDETSGALVGAVGLRWIEAGVIELTKMAVEKELRGHGLGTILCQGAIDRARALGARKIILFSQSGLLAALAVYRKLGFADVPLERSTYSYARADVRMELLLEPVDKIPDTERHSVQNI